ncbi:hypothetical protein VTK73DRAFT_985 [Phialemonium thermophilum]|uniref:Carrier domain-containing protein n=1 Tax=Phialemonium thermophilum TaxID=223376 RepID=A0ABR3XCA9_9PEZI
MAQVLRTSTPNLGQLLADQVVRNSDKTAIVDGSLRLTYTQLHHQASRLALKLRTLGLEDEDAVLILPPRGAPHIVSQVAVVYAGGTCLPLEPTMSYDEVQDRAGRARARYAIVCASQLGIKLPEPVVQVIFDEEDGKQEEDNSSAQRLPPPPHKDNFPRAVPDDYRSHVLFTSGSTGTPKGVEVLGRGVVRLRSGFFEPTDRVAHLCSVCFDASLLEFWTPLLIGGTSVVIDRDTLLDPNALLQALHADAVTCVCLTAAVFNAVVQACPGAFQAFRTVVTGGEAANLEAHRKVFETGQPKRLLNAYGPTECGVVATIHVETLQDVLEGEIPLGHALMDTDVQLVDESFGIIEGEGDGELLIGGGALARGYLDNPSMTSQAFVQMRLEPGAPEPKTLYRTGDIVHRDARGQLYWRGRRNNEVKHRGYRVNLDTIEAEVQKTGLVSAVAALRIDDPERLSSWLAACVILKDPETTREECQARVAADLPAYMVPQVVCLDSMPVNRNGKIDRAKLRDELLRRRREEPVANNSNNGISKLSETEAEIKRIWQQVFLLAFGHDDISPDTDFFSYGASSLDVSVITMRIRQVFQVPFLVQHVYENPKLKDMAAEVDRERRGNGDGLDIEELKRAWLTDAGMVDQLDIQQHGSSLPPVDWTANGEGNVFLTGATGFVGAFFLRALLEQPFVRSVWCLVRAKTSDHAKKRILDNMTKYGLLDALSPTSLSKMKPLAGDLSRELLGLDDGVYAELARSISVIFHLGAQVNYNQPYSTHRPANVVGTLNILKLATSSPLQPKPVHYSSSIAVFGPTGILGKTSVSEDDDMDAYIGVIPYETGYGQSQWVADKMLQTAIRRGLPATIFRLGFVLCDDATGVGNKDDFMARLISDAVTIGAYPSLPAQRKELLPVSYAASSLLAIASSPSSLGRAYHITPDAEHASQMDMSDLFQSVERLLGRRLTCLPYREWANRLREFNQRTETRLKPLLPIAHEAVWQGRTRWEVYEGMAAVRNDNVRAALAKADKTQLLSRSGITEEVFGRYLKFLGVGEQEV